MDTDEKAISPESSTGELPVPDLEAMTPEQREEWFKTGQLPKPDSQPGEQQAAESVEQNAEADEAAQDEGVKPPASPTGEPQEYKAKTAKRIQELLTTIENLKMETARLRGMVEGAKLTASPGQRAAEDAAAKQPPRKMPELADYDTIGAWQAAVDEYLHQIVSEGVSKAVAERERLAAERQMAAQLAEKFDEKVAEFEKQHPDFRQLVLRPAEQGGPAITQHMGRFILESPRTAEMLYHLATHVDESKRIAALEPTEALLELAKLERRFFEPRIPEQKQRMVSSAPSPTTDLAGASKAPADPALAALAKGDFTEYERVMNARDIARIRGR